MRKKQDVHQWDSRLKHERGLTRQKSGQEGIQYDKYYESFREKINEIDTKLVMLQEAEDNYYITAQYVLEIANRAYDLFISSEVEEKRQLLKLVLQNLQLNGQMLRYQVIKPFDTIVQCNDSQVWLRIVDDVRTIFQKQKGHTYIPDLGMVLLISQASTANKKKPRY